MNDPIATPVLTVPNYLTYTSGPYDDSRNEDRTSLGNGEGDEDRAAGGGYAIYLTEDWESGIGGGLWTTGLALCKYFASSSHFLQQFRSLHLQKNMKKTRSTPPPPMKTTNDPASSSASAAASLLSSSLFGSGAVGTQASQTQPVVPVRVLELGSGNGFLTVCLITAIAVAAANQRQHQNHTTPEFVAAVDDDDNDNEADKLRWFPGVEVVVTDTAPHLELIQTTIESNLQQILPQIIKKHTSTGTPTTNQPQVQDQEEQEQLQIAVSAIINRSVAVKEYLWGEPYDFSEDDDGAGNDDPNQSRRRNTNFDLIIGSDVAYHDKLHDPLIAALTEFMPASTRENTTTTNTTNTVALIGITMNDTKPIFFTKLLHAGFQYEKLADHLFGADITASRQFGIFAITRSSSCDDEG